MTIDNFSSLGQFMRIAGFSIMQESKSFIELTVATSLRSSLAFIFERQVPRTSFIFIVKVFYLGPKNLSPFKWIVAPQAIFVVNSFDRDCFYSVQLHFSQFCRKNTKSILEYSIQYFGIFSFKKIVRREEVSPFFLLKRRFFI